MFYVYILKSLKDESNYIGYTNDLKRRVKEHNEGQVKSTRHKVPFKLVYYEAYLYSREAKIRERNLKKFAGAYNALKRRVSL